MEIRDFWMQEGRPILSAQRKTLGAIAPGHVYVEGNAVE
jgi:hypothetical protein